MNEHRPEPDPALERAAMEVLARGALSLDELRLELAKDHRIVRADELQFVRWHRDVYDFSDETFGHVPTLAEGLVLTHVLSEEELELGKLDPGVDLGFWSDAADEGIPLASGGELRSEYAGAGGAMPGESGLALTGPDGWLDGFEAGDVIGLRYVGGQALLERADYPDDPDADETYDDEVVAMVQAAQRTVEEEIEYGDPEYPGADAAEIVLRLRQESPDALRRPLPPLGDLLEGLGFETHGGYVGAPGTSWGGEPEVLDERERLVWRAWRTSLALAARSEEVPDAEVLDAEVLETMARSLTGILFDYVAVDMAEPGAEVLAEAMLGAVDPPLTAVPLLLLACAAEDRGDGLLWLSRLEQAVAADPADTNALATLADLRSVAGDAREAKRLYTLAGIDAQADEVRVLRPFLTPPTGGPGRNKLCPCGSGKKYKLCHGRTASHPLPDRAAWLFSKVVLFVQRPPQRQDLLGWGGLLAGTEPEEAAQCGAP